MSGFDAMAEIYDSSRGGLARGAHFAEALAGFLPPVPARVLELGVGTGAVAVALAQRGHQVIGVDVSAAMLARAAPRLSGRLCLADGASLPFGDETFDAGYACWVMNHLADASAALGELRRVLRPGGRFLVMDRSLADRGTDPGAALALEIDRRLGRPGPALRPRSAWFAELGALQGLRSLGIMPTTPWPEPRTLRQAIENFRSRAFGWSGSEEDWAGVVEPLLDEFSARPDVAEVAVFHQGHEVLVLGREA